MGKKIDESKIRSIKDMKRRGYSYEFISGYHKLSVQKVQEICESSKGHSVKVTGKQRKKKRTSVNAKIETLVIDMIEKGYGNNYGKYMADGYGKKN